MAAFYPFEAWNADQDLYSAMHASVNWYFEKISRHLGTCTSRNYIRKIGYGNENIYSDLSPFRTQSSLKIYLALSRNIFRQ
ncbi:Regulatory protein BlaR1 [Eubacterium plexicaudatum ASF492]|uniref:Penicillin-binding protein transpeptidase domain-containing protein n=1 Tax=Eubacterium plexicaudatum ASF492 TaxID=1235802 RepID=N1ZYL9_9FIRM|nr:Regulatory protein BlaR1 [Eubacterium plexicaudatum ASF492]